MAEKNHQRLPIKVVIPHNTDYQTPDSGGGPKKVFGEVTSALRNELSNQVLQVENYFKDFFNSSIDIPAVAKVSLKEEAIAKSHRPTSLFNTDTCPIIGNEGLGELYISATKAGLQELSSKIQTSTTKVSESNISTIKKIEPYTTKDIIGTEDLEQFKAGVVKDNTSLKIRLFSHRDVQVDYKVSQAFNRYLQELGIPLPKQLNYGPGLRIYKVTGLRPEYLEPLTRFIGTQSLSLFPTYHILQTASIPRRPLNFEDLAPPDPNLEYPLVGVIDTGTDPNNPLLSPWVAHRH